MSADAAPLNFNDTKPSELLADYSGFLILTAEGKPKPLLANALVALRYDPEWCGVLAFNEFSLYTCTKKAPPWPNAETSENWTDHHDSLTANWLQHRGILVNSKVACEAVQTVARENAFHPVRDYLAALTWDETPRIGQWLTTYLGAEATPFVAAVGARWLISAVARIFRPGCQVDHTLLLEGPQGIKKSSALRVLASDAWFADHISDLGSKDSRIELHGKWILELSEMDRVKRGEQERTKAFLTARSDHFRVPYGRRCEDVPRTCVFAASVNDCDSLTDETGGRRFWPVRCGRIDIDSLARDRDQLWAEAYREYQAGAAWWLDNDSLNGLAKAEQEMRYSEGVWDQIILEWVDNPTQREENDNGTQLPITPFDSSCDRVTVTDVLVHGIGKPQDRLTQSDRNQVVRCLVHAGWKRTRAGAGAQRGKWFYEKERQ